MFSLSQLFCKIENPGFALCNLCKGKEINYGRKGSYALIAHVQTKKHLELVHNVITTHSVTEPVLSGNIEGGQEISSRRPISRSSKKIAKMCETAPIFISQFLDTALLWYLAADQYVEAKHL